MKVENKEMAKRSEEKKRKKKAKLFSLNSTESP